MLSVAKEASKRIRYLNSSQVPEPRITVTFTAHTPFYTAN